MTPIMSHGFNACDLFEHRNCLIGFDLLKDVEWLTQESQLMDIRL